MYSHLYSDHKLTSLCPTCGVVLAHPDALKLHTEMVHTRYQEKFPFYCNFCDVGLLSQKGSNEHEQLHGQNAQQGRLYGCVFCDRDFAHIKNLKNHVKTCHIEEPSDPGAKKCDQCGLYLDEKSYILHNEKVHLAQKVTVDSIQAPQNREKSCPICGRNIKSAQMLSHLKIHGMEPDENMAKFQCDMCSARYLGEKQLKAHKKAKHCETSRPLTLFTCTICAKQFKNKITMQRHMECHSVVNSYVCEICKKGFKAKQGLTQHVRVSHFKQKKRYTSSRKSQETQSSSNDPNQHDNNNISIVLNEPVLVTDNPMVSQNVVSDNISDMREPNHSTFISTPSFSDLIQYHQL